MQLQQTVACQYCSAIKGVKASDLTQMSVQGGQDRPCGRLTCQLWSCGWAGNCQRHSAAA
eukprot:355915-Chlamydomonas_euryale.AAC.2